MASVGAWLRGGLGVLLVIFLLAAVRRPNRGVKEEAKRAARAGAEVLASSGGVAGAAGAALLLEESDALKERADKESEQDDSGLNGASWKAAREEEKKKKFGFWKLAILLHVCAVAHCYRAYRRHALGERTSWATELDRRGDADFAYGPCELQGLLSEDRTLLLCSCCCLCVQWADTLSSDKLRLGRFWPLLVVSAVFIIGGMKLFQPHFILVLLAVYYRQRLRAAYGLPWGTARICATDCLLWCCCAPFAALQEARQVEHVPLNRSPKGGRHLSADIFGASPPV